MIRGYMTFRCDDCNNTFRALDIEYGATVMSVPMSCPNCNSCHTYPLNWRILGFYPFGNNHEVYKRIWKRMDKEESRCDSNRLKCDSFH